MTDHSFVNPSAQSCSLAWEIEPGVVKQATFGVLAEEANVRRVAKICFVSYLLGPGRKIVLGHGPMTDDS